MMIPRQISDLTHTKHFLGSFHNYQILFFVQYTFEMPSAKCQPFWLGAHESI